MNYNKLFFYYSFPEFLNDKNNEFILLDLKKINQFDYITIQDLYNSKSNVDYYYHSIYKSFFINENQKKRREYLFLQLQKFKFSIMKFIHIVKLKYGTIYNNQNLLLCNLKKNHIQLLENSRIYKFEHIELYKIVHNCFNYNEYNHPKILKICNPYTNIPFSLHNIINIYFILLNFGKIPTLFYLYFNENLDKEKLIMNYNINVFLDCLKRKYKELSYRSKIRNIKTMIQHYEKYNDLITLNSDKLYNYFQTEGYYFYLFKYIKNNYNDQQRFLCYYEAKIINKLEIIYKKENFINQNVLYLQNSQDNNSPVNSPVNSQDNSPVNNLQVDNLQNNIMSFLLSDLRNMN